MELKDLVTKYKPKILKPNTGNVFMQIIKSSLYDIRIYEFEVLKIGTTDTKLMPFAITRSSKTSAFQLKLLRQLGYVFVESDVFEKFAGNSTNIQSQYSLEEALRNELSAKLIDLADGVHSIGRLISTEYERATSTVQDRLDEAGDLPSEKTIDDILDFFPRFHNLNPDSLKDLRSYVEGNKETHLIYFEKARLIQAEKRDRGNIEAFKLISTGANHYYLHDCTAEIISDRIKRSQFKGEMDPPLDYFIAAFYHSGLITEPDKNEDSYALLHYFYICMDNYPLMRKRAYERIDRLYKTFLDEDIDDLKIMDICKSTSLKKLSMELMLIFTLEFDHSSKYFVNALKILEYQANFMQSGEALLVLGDLYSEGFIGASSMDIKDRLNKYTKAFQDADQRIKSLCAERLAVIYSKIFEESKVSRSMNEEELNQILRLSYRFGCYCKQEKSSGADKFFFEFFLRCQDSILRINETKRHSLSPIFSVLENRIRCLEHSIAHMNGYFYIRDTRTYEIYYSILEFLRNRDCIKVARVMKESNMSSLPYGICKHNELPITNDNKTEVCNIYIKEFQKQLLKDRYENTAEILFKMTCMIEENINRISHPDNFTSLAADTNASDNTQEDDLLIVMMLYRQLANIRKHLKKHDPDKKICFLLYKVLGKLAKHSNRSTFKRLVAVVLSNGYGLACSSNEDYLYHYKLEAELATLDDAHKNKKNTAHEPKESFDITFFESLIPKPVYQEIIMIEKISDALSKSIEEIKKEYPELGLLKNKDILLQFERWANSYLKTKNVQENISSTFNDTTFLDSLRISLLETAEQNQIRVFKSGDFLFLDDDNSFFIEKEEYKRAKFIKTAQQFLVVELCVKKSSQLDSFANNLLFFKMFHPSIVNFYGLSAEIKKPKEKKKVPYLSVMVYMDFFVGTVERVGDKLFSGLEQKHIECKLSAVYDIVDLCASMQLLRIEHNSITPTNLVVTEKKKIKLLIPFYSKRFREPSIEPFDNKKPNFRSYAYMNHLGGNRLLKFSFNKLFQATESMQKNISNDTWSVMLFALEMLSGNKFIDIRKTGDSIEMRDRFFSKQSNIFERIRSMIKEMNNGFGFLIKHFAEAFKKIEKGKELSLCEMKSIIKSSIESTFPKTSITTVNAYPLREMFLHTSFSLAEGESSSSRIWMLPRYIDYNLETGHNSQGKGEILHCNIQVLNGLLFEGLPMNDITLEVEEDLSVHISTNSESVLPHKNATVRFSSIFESKQVEREFKDVLKHNEIACDESFVMDTVVRDVFEQYVSIREYFEKDANSFIINHIERLTRDNVEISQDEKTLFKSREVIFGLVIEKLKASSRKENRKKTLTLRSSKFSRKDAVKDGEEEDDFFWESGLSIFGDKFKLKGRVIGGLWKPEMLIFQPISLDHRMATFTLLPDESTCRKIIFKSGIGKFSLIENKSSIETFQDIHVALKTDEIMNTCWIDVFGRFYEGTILNNKIIKGFLFISCCRKYYIEKLKGSVFTAKIEEGEASFEGDINSFKIEGSGKLSVNNRIVYKGNFSNGLPNGAGLLFNLEGQVLFKGILSKGIMHYGTLYQNNYILEGTFYQKKKTVSHLSVVGRNNYSLDNFYCQGGRRTTDHQAILVRGKFFDLFSVLNGPYSIRYPTGASFVGRFSKNLRDGKGVLITSHGHSMVGSWNSRRILGVVNWALKTDPHPLALKKSAGEFTYDLDGNIFQVGLGRTWLHSGAEYSGEFAEGKFHGYGLLKFPSGSYYKGQFENGLYNGYGKLYSFEEQMSIIGQFKNGKAEGVCRNKTESRNIRCWYKDDNTSFIYLERPEIKSLLPESLHRIANARSITLFATLFKSLSSSTIQLSGISEINLIDGGRYEGEIVSNSINGFGRLYRPSSENQSRIDIYYEGGFSNSKFSDLGKKYLDKKKIVVSEFRDGVEQGEGYVADWRNNLTGTFVNGLMHGLWIQYHKKRPIEYTYYRDGLKHGLSVKNVENGLGLIENYSKGELKWVSKMKTNLNN